MNLADPLVFASGRGTRPCCVPLWLLRKQRRRVPEWELPEQELAEQVPEPRVLEPQEQVAPAVLARVPVRPEAASALSESEG